MAKRRVYRTTIVEVREVLHTVEVIAESPAGAIKKARSLLREKGLAFSEARAKAEAHPVEEKFD